MDFTQLRSFNKVFPLYVEKYELFGVDENSSITAKINSIVQALNRVGKLSNDVLKDWNKVMEWAMGEGLDASVDKKVEELIGNGRFDALLQPMFDEINVRVDGFETQLAEIVTVSLKVTNANDITQDLINAISTINSKGGGILNIPYLSSGYTIVTGNINLCNNLIINGNGSTLNIRSSTANVFGFNISGLNNITINNLRFVSTNDKTRANGRNNLGSNVYGISLQGSNININNVYFQCLESGIWINTSTTSDNIHVNNVKSSQTKQPLFMKFVTNSSFVDLELDSPDGADFDHQIYINGQVDNLFFDRLTLTNGIGPAISLKTDIDGQLNTKIRFNNITILNASSGIFMANVQDIQMRNIHVNSPSSTQYYGFSVSGNYNKNILLDGFYINGFSNSISLGTTDTLKNVTIRNGYMTNYYTNTIVLVNNSNVRFENLTFDGDTLTSARIFFTATSAVNNIVSIRNCNFLYATKPVNEPISIRGTDVFIIEGCQFINNGVALSFVMNNYSPAKVYTKDNWYHGFTTFRYASDTAGTLEYNNVVI